MKKYAFLLWCLTAFFVHTSAEAQNRTPITPTTRILFLLDASGSMQAEWEGKKRITVARKVLREQLEKLGQTKNLELALRVYGHQYDNKLRNCTDSKLEVPFGVGSAAKITHKLGEIYPRGTTPIAYSLEKAADDFPQAKNSRNVIIMITDGIESCGGDPCALSLALQKKHIFLRPFVIGLGLEPKYQKAFECMGRFYNAQNVGQLKNILQNALQQTLGKTTVSVELQDQAGNSVEKDVNVSFENSVTGETLHDYVHYRDRNNKTDMLDIDAILTYKVTVHTLPAVHRENVTFKGGQHNTLPIKTPQGKLQIRQEGAGDYSNALQALIRKHGKMTTLATQRVGTSQRYLIGTYDLEVLTRPRTHFRQVKIEQGKTKILQIPSPGILSIVDNIKGFGSIYLLEKNGKQTWVYDFEGDKLPQNVTLQPGKYKIVFRPKEALGSKHTKVKIVKLGEGKTLGISILR